MSGIGILGIVIFVFLVSIILISIKNENEPIEFSDVMAVLFFSILAAGIFMLLTLIPEGACKIVLPAEPQSITPIAALVDDEKTTVTCYLRQGNISENLYYCYIVKDEYGYKQEKIRVNDDTRIKYISDYETPHLEIYKYEYRSNLAQFYYGSPQDYFYVFCVPKGSIVTEGQFEIDMN